MHPAQAIRRPELGHLGIGSPADVSLLQLEDGAFEFLDVEGLTRQGEVHLRPAAMVIEGKWWSPNENP